MSDQTTLGGDPVVQVVNRESSHFTVSIGRQDGNHMNNTPVGDPGWLGNPYPKSQYGREKCIELFRADFEERLASDAEFRAAVEDLRGEILGCYCKPKACHGDVIVEYIRDNQDGQQ